MAKKKKYHDGKVEKLWPFLVELNASEPEMFRSPSLLRARVAKAWTQLNDETKCPNCEGSMSMYNFNLDVLNVLLVEYMGNIVKGRLKAGMGLSEANKVHVVGEDIPDGVRHRTSYCRQLGLIAKVKDENGKQKREEGWLITKRGFAALRGEEVPKSVVVFNNKIVERSEETTTFSKVLREYKETQYRDAVDKHNPSEWVDIAGFYPGML